MIRFSLDAIFWGYSGMDVLQTDAIPVLFLGTILVLECTKCSIDQYKAVSLQMFDL